MANKVLIINKKVLLNNGKVLAVPKSMPDIFGTDYIYDTDATSILQFAFYYNPGIKGIIAKNATSIGSSAFDSCTSLTSANLPNATTIGSYAFYQCSSLTSVYIPKMQTAGSRVFYSCGKLQKVIVDDVSYITMCDYGSYDSNPWYNSSSAKLYIGENVITDIKSEKATKVGQYAFYYCSNLTSIDLPNATSIGSYAFYKCSALTSANLPKVKTIGQYAFYSCTSLTLLDFRNIEAVPTLSSTNAIPTNAGLQIVVPDSLYDSWCTATNWASFTSYIVKESEYTGV